MVKPMHPQLLPHTHESKESPSYFPIYTYQVDNIHFPMSRLLSCLN
jgi:hypothetical protein